MIPKKIHYCWFGRKSKPNSVLKCIGSWKKYCVDYEIIEWNEDNFDINQTPYMQYCYNNKKWAFLSDYARLKIIEKHGGIYLDTDVEVIKSFDSLLLHEAFFGFETNKYVATGLGFGSEAKQVVVQAMIKKYDDLKPDENGNYPLINCPRLNTEALVEFGLVHSGLKQDLGNVVVYPVEYFNPYDDPTGQLYCTEKTYSIHWYSKSWMSKRKIFRSFVMKPIHRLFGIDCLKKH